MYPIRDWKITLHEVAKNIVDFGMLKGTEKRGAPRDNYLKADPPFSFGGSAQPEAMLTAPFAANLTLAPRKSASNQYKEDPQPKKTGSVVRTIRWVRRLMLSGKRSGRFRKRISSLLQQKNRCFSLDDPESSIVCCMDFSKESKNLFTAFAAVGWISSFWSETIRFKLTSGWTVGFEEILSTNRHTRWFKLFSSSWITTQWRRAHARAYRFTDS